MSSDTEIILYADFEGKLLQDELNKYNLQLNVIGIEQHQPRLQINNKIFKGTYMDAIGMYAFFDTSEIQRATETNTDLENKMAYDIVAKTDKLLTLNRVLVKHKKGLEDGTKTLYDAGVNYIYDYKEDKFISNTDYCEALNQFLKPGQLPPRQLDMNVEK